MKEITLIYFSPTQTTRTVLEEIAKGMGKKVAKVVDITLPATRFQLAPKFENEIVLMGAPVYSGRIPKDAADYFKTLQADHTPVVPVVVYGNREFDDALLELTDIAQDCGFDPMAASAFVGEHSFSSTEFPTALNRPDAQDLEQAFAFGKKIAEHLETGKAPGALKVPGNHPYKQGMGKGAFAFIDVSDDCDDCGVCVTACPKEAVDETKGYATIDDRCIFCCACIKACPQNARSLKEGPMKDKAKWLNENCSTRKDPQIFFPEIA
ncbi:MAG: 4Fe-4S binding protein [Desulfobacter sp.]|nr:4Fe-4S binding protein [Desulfobacter sp.]